MNLANKITLSRIFITPLFIAGILSSSVTWRIIAVACFAYGSVSDWLDGMLARKYGYVSDFGKFIDPLADKIFICAAFISFVEMPQLGIPSWMVIIIITREFIITGLRTLAVSKGIVLPAKKSGKFKTTSQLIAIGIILVILLMDSLGYTAPYLDIIPLCAMIIVTLLTTISGCSYLIQHKNLFITG